MEDVVSQANSSKRESAGPVGSGDGQSNSVIEQEAQNGTGGAELAAETRPDLSGAPVAMIGPETTSELTSSHSSDIPLLLSKMEERILDTFERKLAFDASKEKQIDRLHDELQGHRADLVLKAVRPVFQSLIRLHDDFGKVLDALDREDPNQLNPERLLKLLKGFRDDVELALSDNGVQAFRTETETFDPRRQRVLRTVETTEQTQIGRLEARLRPGFEYGETILEKERVAVYARPQPTQTR
jgi:molecular chaperone GrpE